MGGGPFVPISRDSYLLGQSVTNVVVQMGDKVRRNAQFWDVPVYFDVVIPVSDISDVDLVPCNIYNGLQFKVNDSVTGADVTSQVQLPGPTPFRTTRLERARPITARAGPHVITISCCELLAIRDEAVVAGVKVWTPAPEPSVEVVQKRFGFLRL